MPDRTSDDDPLVRSWRRSLDRLRSEEERGREEPPERGPPGNRSREAARPAEARGFPRRLVVGAVVLLLGAVVGFLVWNAGRGEDAGGAGTPTPVAAAGEAAPAESAAASAAASGAASAADSAPAPEASAPVADGPTADSAAVGGSAAPGDTASEPGETPELLDLAIGDSLLAVSPGASVDLPVRIRDASGRGRAGVALVLDGSEELPGVEERLEAVTDSAGRAVFRFPVGAAPDTVVMDVLARGYWLRGPIRVIVRVLP